MIPSTRNAAADPDFDLIYFDGTGFSLIPCVPYAWQLRGEALEIPSVHSPRLNVLGFLNLNGSFESYVFEGPINSEVLIKTANLSTAIWNIRQPHEF